MVSVVLGAALFFLCYKIQNGRWTNFIATVTTTTRPNGCRETKPKKIYHSLPARIQLGNFFFSFESTVEMIFLAEVLSEGSQLGLIDSMRVTDRFLSLSFFLSLSLLDLSSFYVRSLSTGFSGLVTCSFGAVSSTITRHPFLDPRPPPFMHGLGFWLIWNGVLHLTSRRHAIQSISCIRRARKRVPLSL